MKNITNAMKNHLAGELTTLATCWKCELTNGTILGFTSHSEDIYFDGVNYLASTGFTPTMVDSSNKLNVDNLEVEGLLSSPSITEADLLAGLWDYAKVQVFMINYNDVSIGKIILRDGVLGQVESGRVSFKAEIRGIAQYLQNQVGDLSSTTCRAKFCDNKCKLNTNDFTVSGTITEVTSKIIIKDSSRTENDNWFRNGVITFTSGEMAGLSLEVKEYTKTGGIIELFLPLDRPVVVGDTYSMIAGCNKTLKVNGAYTGDCKVKFNNVINFRGEPEIPGIDKAVTGK